MAYDWHRWEAASSNCSGGPQPGASALMNWCLTNYQASKNLGIYNCRTVRGSTAPSMHGEGRAIDVGFPVLNRKAHADGSRLLEDLAKHAGDLGLQCIIWNRRIYSARSPRGRKYTGTNPHIDHLHIELTREAAKHLTPQRIAQVLGRAEAPTAPEKSKVEALPTLRLRRPRMTGSYVTKVQELINEKRAHGKIKVDGVFGPNTRRAVTQFQATRRLKPDGIVGPRTWEALLENVAADLPTLRLTTPYTRGQSVRLLQEKLGRVAVDGIFGPNTRSAVQSFQRKKGLVADGIVGPKTWRALLS